MDEKGTSRKDGNEEPEATSKKVLRSTKFIRQLVLVDEVRKAQDWCTHTLEAKKDLILCQQCGAIWWKE